MSAQIRRARRAYCDVFAATQNGDLGIAEQL
jgi:hypothetical protein